MSMILVVRNDSAIRGAYRRGDLLSLGERICAGERVRRDVEVSLLLCDDPFIQELNRKYRHKNAPTDVLSFAQPALDVPGPMALGDIVISLDTVAKRAPGRNPETRIAAIRQDVRVLFCHGMLHLLEYTHATKCDREHMKAKQAEYLGLPPDEAWPDASPGRRTVTR